jgi:hypothetical protein
LAAHEADTTSIHGVADTSALINTTTGAAAYLGRETSVFEDFSNATDYLDHLFVEGGGAGSAPPADSSFTVTGGKGVLSSGTNDDIYLKTGTLTFREGFSLVTQTQRTADNGGFTELEMGVAGVGFTWHFQWSSTAIQFIRNTSGGLVTDHNVSFASSSPVLRFHVTCSRRQVHYLVWDVTNKLIVCSGTGDLDFYDSSWAEGSLIDFVTTGSGSTTPGSPVAQSIDFFRLTPLATGEATHSAHADLIATGGNVVRSYGGGPLSRQSGTINNVGGGGVAAGGTVTTWIDFPTPFAGVPAMVQATPMGNHENGGNGDCSAWLYSLTASRATFRVKNEGATTQTMDLFWSAEYVG